MTNFCCLALSCCGCEEPPTLTGRSSSYDNAIYRNESSFLSDNSIDMAAFSTSIRTVFTDTEVQASESVTNHTHGKSAAARTSASILIQEVAERSGHRPVFLQGSASDKRNGRIITRSWHWPKDTNVQPSSVTPQKDDLLVLVDVDYYVDVNQMLADHCKPMMLYTFTPSTVSKDIGEYKYCFNKDNTVDYIVTGGGKYHHPVWNYDGDSTVGVSTYFWNLIRTSYTTYSLERRQIDDDHQVVLLTPIVSVQGIIASWFAYKRMGKKPIERLTPVDGDFVRMLVNKSSGLEVHTAKVGGFAKASCLVSIDDTIASAAVTSKVALSHPMVKSKLDINNDRSLTTGSEILLEYHLYKTKPKPLVMVHMADYHVRRYQWCGSLDEFEADATPSLQPFMAPLINMACAPDRTRGNDKRAIEKRVKAVADNTELRPYMIKLMDEFIELMVGVIGEELHPVEIDEVYERQAKPTQRHILNSTEHTNPERKVKSFVKAEAYPNINDPRVISTINGNDKLAYSQFMYALSDKLKLFDWYAFGKSPKYQAMRVAELCEQATTAVNITDFSRMDGHIGPVARAFEMKLTLKLFHTGYRGVLLELLRSQQNLQATTRLGVHYDTLLSRLSGSAETSPFNTLDNTFIAYVGLRSHLRTSPTDAWNKLGLYAGDDGLTPDVPSSVYVRAAKNVGQVLDCVQVKRGDTGIVFLARQYGPNVWHGDYNSTCDFRRVLSKFHTTVSLPPNITKADKLHDKAFCLLLSDANSPIIGKFVNKVMDLYPDKLFTNATRAWLTTTEVDEQYPNADDDDWMAPLFHQQLPDFDIDLFNEWIRHADEESILTPPTLYPHENPTVKSDDLVVVDSELVFGTVGSVPAPTPSDKIRSRRPNSNPTTSRTARSAHASPPKRSRSRNKSSKRFVLTDQFKTK